MAKTIENLFSYLVYVFDIAIIVLAYIALTKSPKQPVLYTILSYCALNSICNLAQSFIYSRNTEYIVLTCFTLIEFVLISSIISLFVKSKGFNKTVIVATITFLILLIINYRTGKSQSIDALPIGIETILIFIFTFYYLYKQTNILDDSFIYSRYHFWFVIGSMVYLGGSFFIYIFTNQFTNQSQVEVLDNYWFLTYVFYIIKNIFFGIGIYLLIKPRKANHLKNFLPYLN